LGPRENIVNGLFYALSIIGIFVIIRWFIRNDGRSKTSGLLAMKEGDVNETEPE
jgi:hypothetical protein